MPISGSFVRGDWSGRVQSFAGTYNLGVMNSQSLQTSSFIYDRTMESSSVTTSMIRNRGSSEPSSAGARQGISFAAPTSYLSDGSFGRHMQTGVSKETTLGSPTTPSLRLDYPGFWRFRWVVRGGNRSVSVLAQQNSTGSNRPSMVVKANPNVGLYFDISASAANGAGWINMGPLTFTALSGSQDTVWVELHNNDYAIINTNAQLISTPAYFDHIVVS